MNRRTVLGGLAAAGAAGGGLWFAMANSRSTADGTTPDDGGDEGASTMAPQEVETLDAPGSSAGTMTIPVSGEVTLVDAFATWCLPCQDQMVELNAAHDDVGDRATFVSVSNEAIGGDFQRSDVVEWWEENDGNWPVGLEKRGNVTRELRISGLPFVAIVDAEGRITWTHQGVAKAGTFVEQIESALE